MLVFKDSLLVRVGLPLPGVFHLLFLAGHMFPDHRFSLLTDLCFILFTFLFLMLIFVTFTWYVMVSRGKYCK